MTSGGAAAQAEVEEGQSGRSEVLVIPFEPDLNVPITYSLVLEKRRPSGVKTLTFEQELRFDRIAEGYVVHINPLALSVGGTTLNLRDAHALNQLPPAIRPFIVSVTVELDPSGEPIRLRNWEEHKALLSQLPNLVMEDADVGDRAQAEKAVELIFGPFINATAEDAPAMIVQGWPDILGYGGTELEDGEIYQADTAIEGGLLPAPVFAVAQLSLHRTDDGHIRFVQSVKADSDQLKGAISAIVSQLEAASGRSYEQAGGSADHPKSDLEMIDELDVVFDARTGIPAKAIITRQTIINQTVVSGDTITISQIKQ